MRALRSCLLAVVLLLPLALRAADPPLPDAGDQEAWQQEMRDARQALAEARERHEAAEVAYKRMRHHSRGRGEVKAAILAEREEAARALAEAERRLEELPEEARRAGVPPGWLEPDADEPAAPAD